MTTRPFPVRPMLAAYIAGLFDGEGSIAVTYSRPSPTRRRGHYNLLVAINMSHESTIASLHRRFGGSQRTYQPTRGRRLYGWAVGEWRAIRFLRTVRPFLHVKRAQADLAFRFMETKRAEHRKLFDQLPQGILERRTAFYEQMGMLNESHWWRKRRLSGGHSK